MSCSYCSSKKKSKIVNHNFFYKCLKFKFLRNMSNYENLQVPTSNCVVENS